MSVILHLKLACVVGSLVVIAGFALLACDHGGCNGLANDAPAVDSTAKSGTAPTPQGGTVVDGTYFLTTLNEYGSGGPTALGRRSTMVIQGSDMQHVTDEQGIATDRGSNTFTTSATTFTTNATCPTDATATSSYTATATTLTFYFDLGAGHTSEQINTRQ